ncbi:MAG: BON domain-containing protein [Xanthomonadales bacterium]|nr:BON domain-containing protein [Xanthomonadales bacterium]
MKNNNLVASMAVAGMLALSAPVFASSNAMPQTPDNGSEQPVTDTWITTKVKAELATTEGVKSTEISVTTVDGVVTLTGVLASETGREKAIAAAKSIKGVKRVDASGLKAS